MHTKVDWKSVVFDGDWLKRLDQLAIRRFGEGGLAEEATGYVIEKISVDDWAVLTSYKGRSNPKTFLNTVAGNYIEEFSRKRFGRARPPVWLQKQGELWTHVWRMVCLERQVTEAVVNKLSFQNIRESQTIRSIIRTIKGRLPWCGDSSREISSAGIENEIEQVAPETQSNPDQSMDESVLTDFLIVMSNILQQDQTVRPVPDIGNLVTSQYARDWKNKISRFKSLLRLSDEERLILKMNFQDGLKLNVIAKTLGMQSHLPGRIIKRAIGKIEAALTNTNIRMDDLRELAI